MVAGRRTIGAQAVVLALVLGGGIARVATYDGAPPQRLVSFSAASSAARHASTAHYEMTVTTTAGGNTAIFTMTGESEFATKRVAMTMDLSSVGRGSMRVVGQGNTGWIEVPASSLPRTGGRHWVSYEASGGAAESAGGDPAAVLDRLAKLGDQVPREVGEDTVRGVETTRYHLDLTLDQFAGLLPAEQADALRASGAGSLVAGVEAWIDDDGLPRRVEVTVETRGLDVVTRVEMFDFGEPVHIELPPAADTLSVGSTGEAMSIVGLPTP